MRLPGPVCAQGTCLDDPCSCHLPAAQAVVEGPLPQRQNPQRSFAAANVREGSSAEHPPPPSLQPRARSPTPGGGDLGHPGRPGGLEEGLPSGHSSGWKKRPGASGTSASVFGHRGRRPRPGLRAPSPACPRLPLCTPLHP